MLPRIRELTPLPELRLRIRFDDDRCVIYNVADDLSLPGYSVLRDQPGLFQQAQLDSSRTVVYWSDEIDLPSDTLYEYGLDV